jgi:hypothetical protein
MPLRGYEFMSELKLRPTKREAGASCRRFTHRFRGGLSYAAPPFDAAAAPQGKTALVGCRQLLGQEGAALSIAGPRAKTVVAAQIKERRYV